VDAVIAASIFEGNRKESSESKGSLGLA